MIFPDDKFATTWNIALFILLTYTAIIMPYRIAFIEPVWGDEWFYIEIVVDFLFFFDILVNLNSAYFNIEHELITDRKVIFWRYLKSWLLIDLIACIPINLIESALDEQTDTSRNNEDIMHYNNALRFARLPRIYRIVRLTRLFKAFKFNYKSCMQKVLDCLRVRQSLVRTVNTTITCMTVAHILACNWYLIAKIEGFGPDTWVVRFDLIDEPNSFKYLSAFYWTFQTVTTVGYGDISAYTQMEKIFSIIVMFFGVCFFSLVMANLSSVFGRMDSKETILINKLQILEEFSREAGLDKDLKMRFRHALQYNSTKNGYSGADTLSIFNELPRKLKFEVSMVMHKGAAASIPFFKGRDNVFISTIVPFLGHREVLAGENVYNIGDHSDEVYFIRTGTAGYLVRDEVFRFIKPGSYFGEIEVLRQI